MFKTVFVALSIAPPFAWAHDLHEAVPMQADKTPRAAVINDESRTVLFEITKDRPSGKDWNSKDEPIQVRRGDVIRIVDLEGGHWFHSFGQPCPHGNRAIGSGYDCVINANAPLGPVASYVGEHNIPQHGLARLYIEIVE